MRFSAITTGALAVAASFGALSAPAQARDAYIGEIMMFGGTFCPRNWAPAQGQLLPISSNSALFSILGTTYGGDGRTTFGLPDLRGRVPVGVGQGPGLSSYSLGAKGGAENTSTSQVRTAPSTAANGVNALTARGVGLENRQPYTAIRYCIAIQGIFPPRS
ncbi:MAG: tail fiber protein [Pseudomonadota bacterium]